MSRQRFATGKRALAKLFTVAAAALTSSLLSLPAHAVDLSEARIIPASLSSAVMAQRAQPALVHVRVTDAMLAAYVERQQALRNFDGFEVPSEDELTETVLLGYIARQRNMALEAIEHVDVSGAPALTQAVLSDYARSDFKPTRKKVELAADEKLCLTQAIYHEARGETEDGQWAVANVIINRAFSRKYPSTICGVVFQNADKGRYRCQFTFACDGRSDMGNEKSAWRRSAQMAERAYADFVRGSRPDVVPDSTLYYHTTAVAPSWSRSFRRVATIGSHIFYSPE
ncbi:cell wall hydrolase [Arsenicitalea aurantiaca]|uniref:Cell wall hydrolase n=1 Tax=Arsenicitalea aurantiaca TaxID=1783274 RepID=A0A433X893_9HYPH|nr:cell wall hydrolase [Arsenicitalea aurantiaca]RUT30286.1 cell wall hydrolase [Arsenicitalea aurantiaca]